MKVNVLLENNYFTVATFAKNICIFLYRTSFHTKTNNAFHNVKQAEKYRIGIAELQKIRWQRDGNFQSENHVLFHSGGENRRNGVGFLVNKETKDGNF